MKLIRLLIISVVLLFVVVTGMSLLIPSNVRISRATNMSVTTDSVRPFIANIHRWPEWNPFFQSTAGTGVIDYDSAGAPSGMDVDGMQIRWLEKKDEELIASMDKAGFKTVVSGWKFITHPGTDSTTLQWYMDFKLKWYPWEKFSSLLFEKNYGIRMEQGLNNLKILTTGNR